MLLLQSGLLASAGAGLNRNFEGHSRNSKKDRSLIDLEHSFFGKPTQTHAPQRIVDIFVLFRSY